MILPIDWRMCRLVIYLLFNEGYQSSSPDRAVREDLCEEAVRMALLLAEHSVTAGSNASAFLALLLFHAARLDERLDSSGQLVLLEQQDRSKWDQRLLREAFRWFARATTGVHVSRYHAEAWIAVSTVVPTVLPTRLAEHRKAYDLLIQIEPSPIYRLTARLRLARLMVPVLACASSKRSRRTKPCVNIISGTQCTVISISSWKKWTLLARATARRSD